MPMETGYGFFPAGPPERLTLASASQPRSAHTLELLLPEVRSACRRGCVPVWRGGQGATA